MSGNPDKRTTAYENIFGRPTAKPKGPQVQPPPGSSYNSQSQPPAPNNPQYWAQQQASQSSYYSNQPPRWNSNPSSSNGNHYPYNQARAPSFGSQAAVPFYNGQVAVAAGGSGGGGYAQDPIDRRASVAPSLSSQDPRNSYYPNSHHGSSPPPPNSNDGFYGGAPSAGDSVGQTAASAYAASYYGGVAGSTNPLNDVNGGGGGYSNPNVPPSNFQSNLQGGAGPYSTNAGGFQQHRLPHPNESVNSFNDSSIPPKSPPRLPSIDVHGGSQENWFTGGNGSSNGQHGNVVPTSIAHQANHGNGNSNGTSTPTSPVIKVNNMEGGKENEGYPQSSGEYGGELRVLEKSDVWVGIMCAHRVSLMQ